jgi:pyruvate dehydrogenase E2 component (dihydrolipoamide acetyltransferase)
MAEFFEMPQASPTMEVGTLLSWRKSEGDKLEPEDVLAEVETDKAAMEIEVFDPGYLIKILVEEGEEVPAGHPIAIVGPDPAADVSALIAKAKDMGAGAAPSGGGQPSPPPAAAPAAQQAPAATGVVAFEWHGKKLDPSIMEMPVSFGADIAPDVRAGPAARRAAHEHHVNLATVQGTGAHGRVLRGDVELTLQPSASVSNDLVVRNSQMRKTIAKRLLAVHTDAPTFYLTAAYDCDALVAFRSQLKAAGERISYNDILIKACARALRDVPEVNASWGEQAITRWGGVHIGVAVAIEDGLITPVVRDADRKPLAMIGAEIRDLAGKARERKLTAEQYTGSTFTISNLGMMGIEEFTAIINPPEAAIMAVGAMAREAVVTDAGIVSMWRMRVTLTCDHRVVDGALGARFLTAVRRYIEAPALLA